jgi:hypothetical protein
VIDDDSNYNLIWYSWYANPEALRKLCLLTHIKIVPCKDCECLQIAYS